MKSISQNLNSIVGILIFLLMLIGCSAGHEKSGDVIPIHVKEGIGKKENRKLSELVEDIELIHFEQSADTYFLNARSFSVGEKYIMVADDGQDRIILFDRQGRFIRHIGQKGKGPGEFNHPWQSIMDPEEKFIFVADGIVRKVIKYSIDGSFIKEVKTDDLAPGRIIDDIQFLNDTQLILLMRRPYQESVDYANMVIIDKDLNLIKKVLERSAENSADPIQRSRHNMGRNTTRFYFWESMTDTLYTITRDGEAIPTHRIIFDKATEPFQGMMDPNEINPESYLFSATEFDQYIKISGINKGERFSVTFDNNTKNLSELNLENDLFGGGTIYPRRYIPRIDRYIAWSRPSWFASENDLDSVRQLDVKYPKLRDEFLNIAEDPEEEMSLLMILLKIKSQPKTTKVSSRT